MTELTRIINLFRDAIRHWYQYLRSILWYILINLLISMYEKSHWFTSNKEEMSKILRLWFLINILISFNSKIQNSLRQRIHYK